MSEKKRLDVRLMELYPQYSRMQLSAWIMRGEVFVNDNKQVKSGHGVRESDVITMHATQPKYVSRAGNKLEAAINHFNIALQSLVMLDAGLSTGGFTDCLLQNGVAKVYGVDVGYGQVHEKIRTDKRVIILERTNLRELSSVGELVNGITLDLSFISVAKVITSVCSLLASDGFVVVLIKPQFEAGREHIGSGGIVRDASVHRDVVDRVTIDFKKAGFACVGVIESPIFGADGNKEFLGYFVRV